MWSPPFWDTQAAPGPPGHPAALLEVDGAGGRHRAAILRDHRQVCGAPAVWRVELRLVVGGQVRGAVGDPGPELGGEELGGHVADHLPRPQSCPEGVKEVGRGHRLVRAVLRKPQPVAPTTTLLRLSLTWPARTPSPQPLSLLLPSISE